METYFFNLSYLRRYIEDPDGTELPDLEAAKSEARQIARDLAAEYLRRAEPFDLHTIRICTEDGKLLAEVAVADALSEVILPQIFKPTPPDNHV